MQIGFKHILIGACAVLALSACGQTSKNYWKTVKGYYHGYVNKPATLDMDDMGVYSPGEGVLAETVPPLERVFEQFKRSLFSLDKAPSDAWMHTFVSRFPWIDGVALVDKEGNIQHRWPTVSVKEYNFAFLKDSKVNPRVRHLVGYAEETPLGPEVYVATQIVDQGQPSGFFVVYFDPRSLFGHVQNSSEFMVAAPGALLWPGKFDAPTTPVATANWASLTSSTSGTVSNATGEFVWYSYYLGTLPLVFAAPNKGDFPEVPGQMEMLSSFQGVDSGEAITSAVMTESAPEREPGERMILAPPAEEGMAPAEKSDVQEKPVNE